MALTTCRDPVLTDLIRVQNPVNGAWYSFMLFDNGMIQSFREGKVIGSYWDFVTDFSWFLPIDDLWNWGKIMTRAAQLVAITRVERCTYPNDTDTDGGVRGVVLQHTDGSRLGFETRYLCRWPDDINTPAETHWNTGDEELPSDAWVLFYEEEKGNG